MKTLITLSILFFSLYAPANEGREAPIVVAPSSMSASQKIPLVLLLHGYTANNKIMKYWFGYANEVEKRQFVLIIPNGLKDSHGNRYWNASPACCDFDHRKNDDKAYLKSLIDQAIAKYPIDTNRIYVVGHSNGAFMAHTMACSYSETIAGIISFAGELSPMEPCQYKKPVSVLQIHAVDDDTIHIGGVLQGYPTLAAYPSTAKTMKTALALNGCKSLVRTGEMFNIASLIPGADTERYAPHDCPSNTAVEFWKIKAYKTLLHSAHSPMLKDEFTTRTLDFIFSHPRN